MLMIGDGHNHRVHIFAVEDLLVAASRRDLLLHGLLSRFVPAVIEIADCDTLYAGYGERRLQQLASAGARSYRGKSDAIARRNGTASAPQLGWLQEGELYRGSRSYGASADPHEIAPR